jgi:methylenetetrahydrofolate--tRNA-(uracil-5-)-methyltransferase
MPEMRDGVRGRRRSGHGGGGDDRTGAALTATVVGGGLAGCEAAWVLAERGVRVTLVEMRPRVATPAHRTGLLAELVCSNSFKSLETSNAHGLLKAELRLLGSLLLRCADEVRVPGGAALAVDRDLFARRATELVGAHPRVRLVREEATTLPDPGVVATGPLTSERLGAAIAARLGVRSLAFYDAIAPIVSADSLDRSRLFAASRYAKGGGSDYLNAPLTETEYGAFVADLAAADRYPAHDFDGVPYFEGCLPVEELACRGRDALRFGPMKPVGLVDPASGRAPHAVVQLRQEDRAGQMWNLVGFQTRLRTGEQQRVFRSIPGLGAAEFLRYGSIHRNSFLNSPAVLTAHLSLKDAPATLVCGQLTGVEGYTESLGTGLLAGINLARVLRGEEPCVPPPTTMLGALLAYLRGADPGDFQPMNANFGLLPPLEAAPRDRAARTARLAARALAAMHTFAAEVGAEAS